MEYQKLPVECQLEIVKHYPLYRCLCKLYNNNYQHIFNDYYGDQKISKNELKKYIQKYKPAYFHVFYDDKFLNIKISYDHNNIIYESVLTSLTINPKVIKNLMYINSIKTHQQYSYDRKLKLNDNYTCLSPEITREILKERTNCIINTNFFIKNDIDTYQKYLIYDTDLNILLSKLKYMLFNNLYFKNKILLFGYNLIFYNQNIYKDSKVEYIKLLESFEIL